MVSGATEHDGSAAGVESTKASRRSRSGWTRRETLRIGGVAASALVAGALGGFALGRVTAPDATPPHPVVTGGTTTPVTAQGFPVTIAADGRSFVDATGRPFYYVADTAWNAISRMTDEGFEALATTRQRQGFTALQLSLLDFDPSRRDVYGNAPFEATGALDRPRIGEGDDYWDRVDRCLDLGESLGLVVALIPSWYGGWGDSWRGHVTTERAEAYGAFLAERFGGRANVWWLLGGDNDPTDSGEATQGVPGGLDRGPRTEETIAMGRALQAGATTNQLMSYHTARTLTVEEHFGAESWYEISAAYSGENSAPYVAAEYGRETVRPVVLWEAYYDERTRDPILDRRALRAQAYHALLAGAAGFAYGHEQVWPVLEDWGKALDAASAQDIGRFSRFVSSLGVGVLTPASNAAGALGLVPDGYGTEGTASMASAALLPDGEGAVIYFGEPRGTVVVDTTALDPAASYELRWFDPETGDEFFVAADRGGSAIEVSWPSQSNDAVLILRR